ncbi:MAG TPA: glycosyltransferase family 39 protein [Polyangiaceae bacterium]|nr:glycosyltransferase family 39 protein [Polyangiaceae bacterium]
MTARFGSARAFYRGVAATAAAVVVAAHVPALVFARYMNVDEAYAAALAERLLEGQELYRGAVSQRGPLMYYLYEIFAFAFGWDDVRALRVVGIAFVLAHLGLVWLVGRRLVGPGVAAIATIIVAYTTTLGMYPWDGMALNGEALQVPFVLGGVLLGGIAMRSPPMSISRTPRLVSAGLLFGLAITIKQSAGPIALPTLAWMAIDACRRHAWKKSAADACAYGAAVAFPVAVFLAHAALRGTLSELWYYCVTYNFAVHRAGGRRFAEWYRPVYGGLRAQGAFFLLVAVAAAAVLRRWGARLAIAVVKRRWRALCSTFSAEDHLGLHAFAALASAAALPQHFGHYYVLPTPLLALVAACVARRLARPFRVDGALRTVLAAAVSLFVGYGALFVYETIDAKALLTHDRFVLSTAAYIEHATSPGDRVFVWGFSPWLYGYSHRRPAGRYVFETYVTGFIPLFWDDLPREARRVVPGSMEALLGDLDRERPELVADAGSLLIARPMRAYPAAARWLRAHYCFDARVGGVDLYRRRQGDAPCASPYFPCPQPARDHFGTPLSVPVPPVVDPEPSGQLSPGPLDEPARFVPGERPLSCPR